MIKEQFKGFMDFIRTQGVVGLAVGFILGKAVSDLVASLVNDIINPIIGLLFHNISDLAKLSFTIGGSVIAYGKTLSLLLNFIIVACVVYFIIKKAVDILDKPKS
jgi:large conductance mechanosensitive channel